MNAKKWFWLMGGGMSPTDLFVDIYDSVTGLIIDQAYIYNSVTNVTIERARIYNI